MKYLAQKDKKKRISYLSQENKIVSINFLNRSIRQELFERDNNNKRRVHTFSNSVDMSMKYNTQKQIHLRKNQFGRCFAKNRCIFTNRARSVYRRNMISRIKFRSYASFGYICGVSKSSF